MRAAGTIVVALLAVAAVPACGGGREALTVYSGRSQNLIGPVLERFHEQTGVPIDVRYGDSAEVALLLGEEGTRSPADVVWTQSPGATAYLADAGLLEPLPDDLLLRADPSYRSGEGLWVGVTGRQRVLAYNTDLLDEADLPTSVFDVVEEPYAGRVAIAPTNGSFQDFVTVMRGHVGDDRAAAWLQALADTDAPTYANNNAIVEAVSRGEVEMGLVNHYYAERFLDEEPDAPVANHRFPGEDLGALVMPSPASIVAGTDKPEEAAQLVGFLLSEEAQRFFADETFEYPLAAGVPPPADLPPLATLEAPGYDLDRLGGDFQETLALIREAGLG